MFNTTAFARYVCYHSNFGGQIDIVFALLQSMCIQMPLIECLNSIFNKCKITWLLDIKFNNYLITITCINHNLKFIHSITFDFFFTCLMYLISHCEKVHLYFLFNWCKVYFGMRMTLIQGFLFHSFHFKHFSIRFLS